MAFVTTHGLIQVGGYFDSENHLWMQKTEKQIDWKAMPVYISCTEANICNLEGIREILKGIPLEPSKICQLSSPLLLRMDALYKEAREAQLLDLQIACEADALVFKASWWEALISRSCLAIASSALLILASVRAKSTRDSSLFGTAAFGLCVASFINCNEGVYIEASRHRIAWMHRVCALEKKRMEDSKQLLAIRRAAIERCLKPILEKNETDARLEAELADCDLIEKKLFSKP